MKVDSFKGLNLRRNYNSYNRGGREYVLQLIYFFVGGIFDAPKIREGIPNKSN